MDDDSNNKLTLSDWITFLSSESTSNRGNIISLGAFVFAGLAILVAMLNTPHDLTWSITIGLAAVCLGILYWQLELEWGFLACKARGLLDKIMSGAGDMRDPLKLQEEWKKVMEEQERRRKRRKIWQLRPSQWTCSKKDREGKKLETKPSQELSLTDIMKELKSTRRAIWMGPAAFGGSIVLLGTSIWVQQMVGDKSWTAWSIIIIGFAFMFFCMWRALRN